MQSIDEKQIRIGNYNILAQSLLSVSLRGNAKKENKKYLTWNFRKKLIEKQISKLNFDVLCIEEFENDSQFVNELNKMGYEIVFRKRPGSNHLEGCAIIYKKNKFVLEKKFYVEFNISTNSLIYCKQNVAVFALLKSKANEQKILFSCTHLLFNKNRGDIKLGQIYQVMNILNMLHKKYDTDKVVLCCDLNSSPNSAVYEFITKGEINCSKLKTKTLSGQILSEFNISTFSKFKESLIRKVSIYENNPNPNNKEWYDEIIRLKPDINEEKEKIELVEDKDNEGIIELKLKNQFIMSSAYKTMFDKNNNISLDEDLIGEPQITYYSKGYAGTFDYIFHSDGLIPIKTEELPGLKMFTSIHTGIPNKNYPSDHLLLCCDFEI